MPLFLKNLCRALKRLKRTTGHHWSKTNLIQLRHFVITDKESEIAGNKNDYGEVFREERRWPGDLSWWRRLSHTWPNMDRSKRLCDEWILGVWGQKTWFCWTPNPYFTFRCSRASPGKFSRALRPGAPPQTTESVSRGSDWDMQLVLKHLNFEEEGL